MPSGTGEGDNLKRFCLRPSEGWEKVAEGRMRASSPARNTRQEVDFGVGGEGLVPGVAVNPSVDGYGDAALEVGFEAGIGLAQFLEEFADIFCLDRNRGHSTSFLVRFLSADVMAASLGGRVKPIAGRLSSEIMSYAHRPRLRSGRGQGPIAERNGKGEGTWPAKRPHLSHVTS